jgi:3-deoxy-manno-octulosonate cytidylyltransferase (CMP-KDO synthetase)
MNAIKSAVDFLGIIPARYGSTRFPGKPLAMIHGKPMIQHVWERVNQSRLVKNWAVATDDDRIQNAVNDFGGYCILTDTELPSGTDRCKAAMDTSVYSPQWVINVQGDEPFVRIDQIDALANAMKNGNADIGTLVKWNTDAQDYQNPNRVKCVRDQNGQALYFSRSPIPFFQKAEQFKGFWKHLGLYAYTAQFLNQLNTLVPSDIESAESLEQLRWLDNGKKILTIETQWETPCVDTPEDLEAILKLVQS